MQPSRHLGQAELFTHAIDDVANAISQRPGETEDQRLVRYQVAATMMRAFDPRDMIELMFAAHSVMFHVLMTDSVRHSLLGETDAMRNRTRASIIALNRAFHMNMASLKQYRRCSPEAATETADEARQSTRERTIFVQAEAAANAASPRPTRSRTSPSQPIPSQPDRPQAIETGPHTPTRLSPSDGIAPSVAAPPLPCASREIAEAGDTALAETFGTAPGADNPADVAPAATAGPSGGGVGWTAAAPARSPLLNRAQRRQARQRETAIVRADNRKGPEPAQRPLPRVARSN